MKQVKQNNILYVLDTEAYEITQDTDADIIYVPEDSYNDYVELNPTLELTKHNYNTIRVTYELEYFKPIEEKYLTIETITDCTVNFTKLGNEEKIIYYSEDWGETWEPLEESIEVSAYNAIQFKSDLEPINDTTNKLYGIGTFTVSGSFDVSGNPLSLIESDDFKGIESLSAINAFRSLFKACTGLVSAKNLSLKFKALSNNCYLALFSGCTSLVEAPELPAKTLSQSCYGSMFYNCTSLTKAPKLPVKTISNQCYNYMFYGCTNLTEIPELPAKTLTPYCYYGMFNNCTSITKAPKLPATTLASNCYNEMFHGCTSLTTAPELPATTLADNCYFGMFFNCTSLTTAPELPAETLVQSCYSNMFGGCTNLNYIKAMFTTTPTTSYTFNWVRNVAASGTFIKNGDAQWDVSGDYGIPTGWTVVEI